MHSRMAATCFCVLEGGFLNFCTSWFLREGIVWQFPLFLYLSLALSLGVGVGPANIAFMYFMVSSTGGYSLAVSSFSLFLSVTRSLSLSLSHGVGLANIAFMYLLFSLISSNDNNPFHLF